MKSDTQIKQITRSLLFSEEDDSIPGKGRSAAEDSERHVRVKVTMNLDSDIVTRFKEQAKKEGVPYQLLINQVLRQYLDGTSPERLAKQVGELLLSDPSFVNRIKNA